MVLGWSRLALALAGALLLAAPSAQRRNVHKALSSLLSNSRKALTKVGAERGLKHAKKQLSNAYKIYRTRAKPLGPLNVWCCYTYYEEAHGWLRFYSKSANWSTAERVCKQNDAELASVVMIGTETLSIVPHPPVSVHAGIIPSMTDDVHSVIPISYKMLPYNGVFRLFGSMEPIDAKEEYPFICHRKNETVNFTICGTADNGYELDNRTGHCYKFIGKPAVWNDAYEECRAHGAHLVVINNETEAEVVREIFERNPEDTIPGDGQKNVAFVGVFKNIRTGQWATLNDNGKTLEEIGYGRFAPGEPNDARGDEFCMSVLRNGLLQDDPCDRAVPFICERETELPLCPFIGITDRRCDKHSY